MLNTDKQCDTFLYRQVIDLIAENIDSGPLLPGDRLPSLRKMSKTAGVSVPTVRQAYIELERQRRIESRPQSGFYVRHRAANDIVLPTNTDAMMPAPLRCRSLMERVYDGVNCPDLVPLGIANPCMAKPAAKTLHRSMKRVMARAEERSLGYASTLGEPSLRRQIAYHYLDTVGAQVEPDQICITNGGQEDFCVHTGQVLIQLRLRPRSECAVSECAMFRKEINGTVFSQGRFARLPRRILGRRYGGKLA